MIRAGRISAYTRVLSPARPWPSGKTHAYSLHTTSQLLHKSISMNSVAANPPSCQSGPKALSTTVATTDEVLLNTPVDDLVKLPPHLLKDVIGGLRSKIQRAKEREDEFQREMNGIHGHYLDLRLLSPELPRIMGKFEWNALYHDLDSMPEPFPDQKSYEYDGWKAEHGENAEVARRRYANGEHDLRDGEEHISERWYAYQEELAQTWSYGTYEDLRKVSDPADDSFQQGLSFRVHAGRVVVQNNGNVIILGTRGSDFAITPRGLKWNEHISSQLLLFRLVVVFGMPPTEHEGDRYKSAWDVILVHKSGKAAINFYDYKGTSSFAIYAKGQELKDATDLLTHLISDRCLHSYDCTEAGTVA